MEADTAENYTFPTSHVMVTSSTFAMTGASTKTNNAIFYTLYAPPKNNCIGLMQCGADVVETQNDSL